MADARVAVALVFVLLVQPVAGVVALPGGAANAPTDGPGPNALADGPTTAEREAANAYTYRFPYALNTNKASSGWHSRVRVFADGPTTVEADTDADGDFETTRTLAAGESTDFDQPAPGTVLETNRSATVRYSYGAANTGAYEDTRLRYGALTDAQAGTGYYVPIGGGDVHLTATASASVEVDADADGDFETTRSLATGETTTVRNVTQGARIRADAPVHALVQRARWSNLDYTYAATLLPDSAARSTYQIPGEPPYNAKNGTSESGVHVTALRDDTTVSLDLLASDANDTSATLDAGETRTFAVRESADLRADARVAAVYAYHVRATDWWNPVRRDYIGAMTPAPSWSVEQSDWNDRHWDGGIRAWSTHEFAPGTAIDYRPDDPTVGDRVTFEGPAANATSYAWDVGDDGSVEGTDTTFAYTFETPGARTVALTTERDGTEHTYRTTVDVDAATSSVRASGPSLDGPIAEGETFTVGVDVAPEEDLYGAQATLAYDAERLAVADVSSGGLLGAGTQVITDEVDESAGTVDYAETRTGSGAATADGTLFVVRFRATERIRGPASLDLGLSDVLLSDADENELGSVAEAGAVTVADGTAPNAALDVPDSVLAGETFTLNASGSTDNDRIANYTFAVDGDPIAGTTEATTELNRSEPGTYSVSVTVADPAGNTDTASATVNVTPGADLAASIDAPARQRIAGDVTANVTVTNDGSAAVEDAAVRLRAAGTYWTRDDESTTRSWTVSLAPGESVTRTANLTAWVRQDLDPTNLATGRISLVARADPDDAVPELNEGNNRATARTAATFSSFVISVWADDRLPEEAAPVNVYLRNVGSAESANRSVELRLGDGTTRTLHTGTVDPGVSVRRAFDYAYDSAGDYEVNASVGDASDTASIGVEAFEIDARSLYVPDTVEAGDSFFAYLDYDTNIRTDATVAVDTPPNVTADDAERRYTDTTGGWVAWELGADAAAAGERRLNVSVSARNTTDSIARNVTVEIPKTRVTDSASVALNDSTDDATTTLDVRPETTYEHNLTLSVGAGTEGRTLDGLQYLFTYPYGCVEQTVSPLLAALYTDQYYRADAREAPSGYDRSRTNASILGGVSRLAPDGDVGQHENGAWSMWGYEESGDLFYTAYAYRGVSAVRADPVQGERSQVELATNATDFNETVSWLRDQQRASGAIPADGYFLDDRPSMTGFVTVSLAQAGPFDAEAERTADALRRDAAAYLLDRQNADGTWGGPRTTALALWGLQSAVDSGALNASVERAANGSIDAAVGALVAAQDDAGAWRSESGYYRDSTALDSSATGYAMLALNATGVPADNATLDAGVRHLVGVYEADGSWGDTRSSAVAIQALQTLGQGLDAVDREVTVEIGDVTETVTVTDADSRVQVTLDAAQREQLRSGDVEKDVTVTSAGSGTAVVAVSNEQLVNENEYEAVAGPASGPNGLATASDGTQVRSEPATPTTAPFTASVSAPETPTTGNGTLAVTVENTADETMLNPLAEVPIPGSVDASNASAYTVVDGDRKVRPVERNASTFTGGESLLVFGREVPAGGERTYYLNVSFTSPGDVPIEADVRPLYNESLNARSNTTLDVRGQGTLSVTVTNASAANVSTVSLDGTSRNLTDGNATASVLAGRTNVSVAGVELPVSVPAFGARSVSYTPASGPDPAVVASVGDPAVIGGSVSRVADREASAEAAGRRNVSFTVAGAEGQTVVSFDAPAGYEHTNATVTGNGTVANVTRADGRTVLRLNATGDVDVSVDYEGYVLGNVTGDEDVTPDDAAAIAALAAGGGDPPAAADVNGDGRVTVVDAMYVAQYASGNRDANYGVVA